MMDGVATNLVIWLKPMLSIDNQTTKQRYDATAEMSTDEHI